MAMAWRPATPAPITSTRAGRDRPRRRGQHGEEPRQRVGGEDDRLVAADRRHGGERVHALRAGRPRHQLDGERRDALARRSPGWSRSIPSGRRKPISTWPWRRSGRSSWPVRSFEPWQRTWTMMSAARKTSRPPGHDLGPPGCVVGVRIAGLRAGPRLHDDLEARLQRGPGRPRAPGPHAARPGSSREGRRRS